LPPTQYFFFIKFLIRSTSSTVSVVVADPVEGLGSAGAAMVGVVLAVVADPVDGLGNCAAGGAGGGVVDGIMGLLGGCKGCAGCAGCAIGVVAPLIRAAVELASTLAVLVVPSARAVLVVVLVVLLL
jgi:hypothetical protein